LFILAIEIIYVSYLLFTKIFLFFDFFNFLFSNLKKQQNKGGVLKGDVKTIIAYGDHSFSKLRSRNGLYIDKTMFIPKLINAEKEAILLLRPTRCGKSLFLSMLGDYFDKNCKGIHKDLFRDLYIATLPDEEKVKMGECYVMKLNFAFNFKSQKTIFRDFNKHINTKIKYFCKQYRIPMDNGMIDNDSASASFENVATELVNENFIVIIDEYDRSMNELLFTTTFSNATKKKQEKNPIYNFLVTLKNISASVKFKYYLTIIAGVSPVAINEISGYNIASDISQAKIFSEICFFNEVVFINELLLILIKQNFIFIYLE
jgi:hypothetical protein